MHRHRRTLLDSLHDEALRTRIRRALDTDASDHVHELDHERYAPCRGCFGCWVDTPGQCGMKDDANPLMRDMLHGDELVWTTRVVNGGWHPVAKAALDRTIAVLLPFFKTVQGETHHYLRYAENPSWGVVAVLPRDAAQRSDLVHQERDLFLRTVQRNTLNLSTDQTWVAFVHEDDDEQAIRAAIAAARAEPLAPARSPVYRDPHPVNGVLPWAPETPGRAVAWIGSGKPPGESASEAVAQGLLDRLAARGWSTELLAGRKAVRMHKASADLLLKSAEQADLLIIAAPIYVDSLPAPVLMGLERLQHGAAPVTLLPLLQCGFPELAHTVLALELIDRVAARWGATVAGHLTMGGGGALNGVDFSGQGGRAWQQLLALDAAADALHGGHRIPAEVSAQFAQPIIGPGLYRAMGNTGWLAQAWQHGALWKLGDRPLAAD